MPVDPADDLKRRIQRLFCRRKFAKTFANQPSLGFNLACSMANVIENSLNVIGRKLVVRNARVKI
jgi:hypothetical protein